MCVYCEEHISKQGDYGVEQLCEREESIYNEGVFTGIEAFIDGGNRLELRAVIDGVNVKPLHSYKTIRINFCPICGRRLTEE